jgi:hypothetical protein
MSEDILESPVLLYEHDTRWTLADVDFFFFKLVI